MANKAMKHPQNAPGKFYCTTPDDPEGEGCTACTYCYGNAPEFYAEDSEGYAYVHWQPVSEEEIRRCNEQMDICPPSAIGDNG